MAEDLAAFQASVKEWMAGIEARVKALEAAAGSSNTPVLPRSVSFDNSTFQPIAVSVPASPFDHLVEPIVPVVDGNSTQKPLSGSHTDNLAGHEGEGERGGGGGGGQSEGLPPSTLPHDSTTTTSATTTTTTALPSNTTPSLSTSATPTTSSTAKAPSASSPRRQRPQEVLNQVEPVGPSTSESTLTAQENKPMYSPRPRPLSVADVLPHDDWVTLCVGGKDFVTTRRTLTILPDSMLDSMFSSAHGWASTKDKHGRYLLDRDPAYFGPVLNYLRTGKIVIDPGISKEGVLEEAMFFQVAPLVDALESELQVPRQIEVFSYIIVRTITLYYSGKARTNMSIDGRLSRTRRRTLMNMQLADVFNALGEWGWSLVSSSGKGGDQEKFVFQKKKLEQETLERVTSPALSDSDSGPEDNEEVGLPFAAMQQAQLAGRQ